jgi:sortase A
MVDARAYQVRAAQQLELPARHIERPVWPSADAPVVLVPLEGEAIGRIDIPRLGIGVAIAQGESEAVLRTAVGHLADTALPGDIGNVVLAGHRDTYFRPLKDIRVGDAITIRTRDGAFEYRVESTSIVPPTDLSVLDATGGRTLTLITCFPFFYIGSAPDRFIVRARAI